MGAHRMPPGMQGPRDLDGRRGNPLRRTEPKVRAASLAALLTSALLYLASRYLPGYEALPAELTAGITATLTGLAAWLAGWLAAAVNRIDLFVALAPPAEPATEEFALPEEPATEEMPILPPVPR